MCSIIARIPSGHTPRGEATLERQLVWRGARPDGTKKIKYKANYLDASVVECWPSLRAVASDSVSSVARLHAYDSEGNHVGHNNSGSIDAEITDCYYQDWTYALDSLHSVNRVASEAISLLVDPAQNYEYAVEIAASCTLSVSGQLTGANEETEVNVYFPKILLESGAVARTFVTNGNIDYELSIDDNGDGSIDRTVKPDSVSHSYTCGDANGDAIVDISDAVYLIGYIFSGGSAPLPLLAGDANCDGTVDISDAVSLIAYIFSGGPAPCAGCK